MRSAGLVALAASLSSVAAVYQGFNYGSTNSDGSPKTLDQFTAEFTTAKNLVGTSGFTSARLYTSIQGGSSTNEPIQAIKAGIQTGTSLLLGVWASGGQNGINAELIALKSAMSEFGLTAAHVAGLSVGSEDLYRISPTGIAAKSGYGADPSVLVSYIAQIRAALQGTALAGVPIGHVDTWTAWVNGSNSAVIDAVDFIGVDAYPYFQNTQSNGIENGASLFNDAYSATVAMAKGKDVWITETGFPVSGPTENLAVPSIANAKTYWDQVGCPRFGKVNTYWYTLFDAPSAPSFGLVGNTLSTTPLFDLSCSAASSSSSSSAAATSSSSSAMAASSTSSAMAASSASSVIAASSSTSSAASSSLTIVVPPLSTVATGSSTSVQATTVPSLVSSGGGLGPTISPPIVSTAVVVTPTSQGANTTPAPTTITTIVGAGNGTATTRASVSATSSASVISTAAASFATVPAIGGALGAVLAFMAAM